MNASNEGLLELERSRAEALFEPSDQGKTVLIVRQVCISDIIPPRGMSHKRGTNFTATLFLWGHTQTEVEQPILERPRSLCLYAVPCHYNMQNKAEPKRP